VQQVFLIAKIDCTDSGKPGPDLEDLCLIFFSKGVKAPLICQKKPATGTADKPSKKKGG